MAAEIRAALGHEVKMTRGSGGIFQVRAGEKVIFDKHQAQRFLEDGEIVQLLERG